MLLLAMYNDRDRCEPGEGEFFRKRPFRCYYLCVLLSREIVLNETQWEGTSELCWAY
jgi:hypothetical protein